MYIYIYIYMRECSLNCLGSSKEQRVCYIKGRFQGYEEFKREVSSTNPLHTLRGWGSNKPLQQSIYHIFDII